MYVALYVQYVSDQIAAMATCSQTQHGQQHKVAPLFIIQHVGCERCLERYEFRCGKKYYDGA